MKEERYTFNGRREAILLALAAAETCWAAPVFLAVIRTTNPHPALPVWLGMLSLLLGFFIFYRVVAAAPLTMRAQQGLLVIGLLLTAGLVLQLHVYGDEYHGLRWFASIFLEIVDPMVIMPRGWVAILALVYLWARGIHLARRSLSVGSVGFSFRSGVVILTVLAFLVGIYSEEEAVGFVAPYFFFSLIAVALARVEEVSLLPGSGPARFSGFWIGTILLSVVLLVGLGAGVAAFFYGGGLRQGLGLLSPLLWVLQIIIAGLGVLMLLLFEALLRLFAIDLAGVGMLLQEALNRLASALNFGAMFAPPAGSEERPAILGILQFTTMMAIPILVVALVLLFTWWRIERSRRASADQEHESLWSAGAAARSLLNALRSGRERLGQLADLVDRFGLGARLLSAITIQRIYANMVRLATRAGYPRLKAQTPYEYLPTLYQALPGREPDAARITTAYVNAHYGRVPDSPEELQRIRDCWQRIQRQGTET